MDVSSRTFCNFYNLTHTSIEYQNHTLLDNCPWLEPFWLCKTKKWRRKPPKLSSCHSSKPNLESNLAIGINFVSLRFHFFIRRHFFHSFLCWLMSTGGSILCVFYHCHCKKNLARLLLNSRAYNIWLIDVCEESCKKSLHNSIRFCTIFTWHNKNCSNIPDSFVVGF